MPFPRHLLTDDEDLVLDLRPHWWQVTPPASLLALVTVFGVMALATSWWGPIDYGIGILWLAALLWFGINYMKWTTTNFVVTNVRVISRSGVVSKEGIEIPLDRINTVFFNQSIFERLIGAGDLGIESAGEGGRQEFSNIRKPNLIQNEIYRQVEGLQDRRLDRLGRAAASGAAMAPVELSIPEQIEKLDQLRRQGVITEEEFQAKKQDLLDRM